MLQKKTLIVDDNLDIYNYYCRVLNAKNDDDSLPRNSEAALLSEPTTSEKDTPHYLIDFAYQEEALETVIKAVTMGAPYALIFISVGISPTLEGIETVKHIWKADPNVQIVICATYSDYSWQDIMQQMQYSDNFLIVKKPVETTEIRQLAAVLTKKWEIITNKFFQEHSGHQSSEKHSEESLFYQTVYDSLTDLPNKALLAERIQQVIFHAKQYGLYVGILVLEIDNFNKINDSLGSHIGDSVVKVVAQEIKKTIRETDTATYLSSDKFVIVMVTPAKQENINALAKRLLKMMGHAIQIEDHEIPVSIKMGISVYPKNSDDPETLLQFANSALQSKEAHSNSFQFYDSESKQYSLQKEEIMTALPDALARKEFRLLYRPLIELNSGKVIGVEALLRWDHPELGELFPMAFIPIAEEMGLVAEIGEWALRIACSQLKIWQAYLPNLRMAVSTPIKQLQQKYFIKIVNKILKETAISPESLDIELTENNILLDRPAMVEKAKELKKLGVHLVIDHFGAGYLSYLQDFPCDKVKIDRRFVNTLVEKGANSSIVEAILNVAKKLNVTVVAKSIGNIEDIEVLRKRYSNLLKGYYAGPLLDEQQCTELVSMQARNS